MLMLASWPLGVLCCRKCIRRFEILSKCHHCSSFCFGDELYDFCLVVLISDVKAFVGVLFFWKTYIIALCASFSPYRLLVLCK